MPIKRQRNFVNERMIREPVMDDAAAVNDTNVIEPDQIANQPGVHADFLRRAQTEIVTPEKLFELLKSRTVKFIMTNDENGLLRFERERQLFR